MKYPETLARLRTYPVFDMNIFASVVGKDRAYAKLLLYRLRKGGKIFELQRNRFTVHNNAFLVASRIFWPSYISFWSALSYHNITEQIPHDIWVLTSRKPRKRAIRLADKNIKFICTKPRSLFGFQKKLYDGFEVFIAEPEKALIDGMLFRKISFSEIASAVRAHAKELNMKKFANYALDTKNKAVIKRTGFLMEKFNIKYCSKLAKHISSSFIPIEYSLPPRGKKNQKWKIIENWVNV